MGQDTQLALVDRFSMSQTRRSSSRSISATEKGKQLLGQAKAARKIAKHSNSFQSLAAATDLSDGTVRKFFKGIPVDKGSAQVICDCLGLDIKEIVDDNPLFTRGLGLKIGKILKSYLKRGKESWLIIGVEGVSGIKARI